jgi:hypothetical protein
MLFFFNDDLWNFKGITNLTNLIDLSITQKVIIVVIGAMNLYDFDIFHESFFVVTSIFQNNN